MSVLSPHRRVAVLRGGPSTGRQFSMRSGQEMLDLLHKTGTVTPVDIVITKNLEWLHGGVSYRPSDVLAHIDMALIALCGEYGEDGQVQRVLDTHGVRYRGSSAMAAHRTLYKPHATREAKAMGIKTPKQLLVSGQSTVDIHSLAHTIGELFGPQYIIKPVADGGGVGVELVAAPAHLPDALYAAITRGVDFIVEEYIPGRSLSCGVVEGLRNTAHYPTFVIEQDQPFTESIATPAHCAQCSCPARLSSTQQQQIIDTTIRLHKGFQLRDYSKVDYRLDDDGQLYFLEINALPLLHSDSPMIQGLAASGVTQKELLYHLMQTH